MPHKDTSVAIKQAINWDLNVPRDTGVAIKQAFNQSILYTEVWSQPLCFNEDTITLHCNQSGVLILTDVLRFIYYKLKLIDVITISMSLSILHSIKTIMLIIYNLHIYKISEDRYKVVKLSLHIFTA